MIEFKLKMTKRLDGIEEIINQEYNHINKEFAITLITNGILTNNYNVFTITQSKRLHLIGRRLHVTTVA